MIIVTRVTIHYWGDYKCYCAIIICILDQEVHYTHIVLQCHGMHTTIFNKFVPRYMTLYMFLHVIPTTKSSQSHASWIWGMNSEFSPLTNPLPTFTTNQGINISIYYSIFPLESLWILWTASCLVNLISRNFSEIMMHETKGFSCYELDVSITWAAHWDVVIIY